MSSNMSEKLALVVTPWAVTSLGSLEDACWTRFCTFTRAMFVSVPVLKVMARE